MKGFIKALAVGLLSLGTAFCAELEPLTIRDFSPGLATENDPSIICDGCSQDLLNVDVEDGSIEKRRGSIKVNSSVIGGFTGKAVKLVHPFDDANDLSWIIVHSSNSLLKSSDGGVTFSVMSSTHGITEDNRFCAVNAYDKARLTDGTTNWILWDGTNVTVSTASPKGKTCEFFAERVWSSVGSYLQASENGDPEDWTQDDGTDSDAFFTYIRQNDGYDIRALKRFKNGLLIFKDYSLDYLVLGQDGLTFNLLPVSSRIGTQQPKTIVERENDVIWMAHDGYYSYDGSVIRRISDAIEPTFNQIAQLSVGENRYTETGQSQFVAGTNSQTTPYISAGSVYLSSWTATDESTSDFQAFTSSSNITITDGRVYLSTNNTNVSNNSFETGTGSTADSWDAPTVGGSDSGRSTAGGAQDGSYSLVGDSNYTSSGGDDCSVDQTGVTLTASLVPAGGGSVLASTSFSPTTSFSQKTITASGLSGRSAFLRLQWGKRIGVGFGTCGPGFGSYDSDDFLLSGSNITFYVKAFGSGNKKVAYDLIEGGRSTHTNGSITGQSRNTSITNPVWFVTSPTYAENSNSITFQTETSSDGTSWDAPVSWTPGSAPTSASKQYIRYTVNFSTTSSGVALPNVDTVPLAARAGSGRYLSSAIDTAGGTSWNPFSALSTEDGGSITFEIYQDSNTAITPTDATTFISSATIANGATPSLSFSNYTFIGATMTISAESQDPFFDEFTVSWNEGSGGNFPAWSTYYQGSYISAVAISSNTGNDRMLVFDRNGAWTVYSYPAYSLGIYRQKPYFGSNLQGDLVRFQADSIFNDYDGSAINSYWTSKDFDFGYPLTDKTITRYYLTAEYSLLSDALFEWGVNRGTLTSETTTGILDLDLNSGFFRKSIAPSSLTYKRGLSHRVKFSDSDTDQYFKILSLTIKSNLETAP